MWLLRFLEGNFQQGFDVWCLLVWSCFVRVENFWWESLFFLLVKLGLRGTFWLGLFY
jgi:hypothetical protein